MATPREHVEQIRKTKFSIGGEPNPVMEDLHQATKHLSAELYAKDVHFLMELIQNAEDNEYLEGVDPSLEFVLTSRDITGTGAPATLLIFNNERGFSSKNIESICSVGRSTKKGNRKRGYIGEKGIGFKSVFLITAQPYIFSNGYQIRFSENPCQHCGLGYIVPEWVEENPSLSDIKKVYGSGAAFPTTTLILPLKSDKVKPVKEQLSTVHPEVLLFLSKIKRLFVREDNEDPRLNTVCEIAITSETDFVKRKSIGAESYTIHLSAEENGDNLEKECSYYMWKQKFPVEEGLKVERRMDVEEWAITLAFPNQERLNRGLSSAGVYAFLPTEMVTNFPFIIQADFLLASSRETILLDDKWNQGILECVSSAFINAFTSLVKMTEDAPISSLPRMFEFLPVKSSSYSKLNAVRESIRARLVEESIVPSESYTRQKFFHKPTELGRLKPVFWNILGKARKQGVGLDNLSSHGCFILSSSFDKAEYDEVLSFLGVKPVDKEWYAKCIQSSNLILGVSEDIYLELLHFLADNWSEFSCSGIKNIPLLKYVGLDGNVSLCSISENIQSAQWNNGRMLCLSQRYCHATWLIDSNREFSCGANRFFMPNSFQEALLKRGNEEVLDWLVNQVKVAVVSVCSYAKVAADHLHNDRKIVVAYVHFLYHSRRKGYLSAQEVTDLCGTMPLVNNYGSVTKKRNGVLVPANGSKWAKFIGLNPWRAEDYIELGEDYLFRSTFAGEHTKSRQLMPFLETYVGASDIPLISPPNAVIPIVSSPLTTENAFLLLDWIHSLRYRGTSIPNRFLNCIKEGSWLKIRMNGSSGYKPPSESFQLAVSLGSVLQNGSVFVDIPLLDESFYGDEIYRYKEELRTIGVKFEYGEACQFIGKRLMSLAASSSLTRSNVLSILRFIRLLRGYSLPPDEFIKSIKEGRWLRTSQGDRSPVGSVLRCKEWETASQISSLPFIDRDYYGGEIIDFTVELQSLGVIVGFNQNYQLLVDCLKSSPFLVSLGPDAALLILQCIRHSSSPGKVIQALKDTKCLKTDLGYKRPDECFLIDTEWGSLLAVFSGFPVIDYRFYGSQILSYKVELKQIGAVVEFEDAAKAFARYFRQQASTSSISKENALSFLSCYRQLNETSHKLPSDLKNCIRDVKWLKTQFGFRTPGDCILYCSGWGSISPIARLPFIDSKYYGKEIYEFKKELEKMRVIVEVKDGLEFVFDGLRFPQDPCFITRVNVCSLLECIRMFLQEKNKSLPEALLKNVSKKWLKTYAGYRMPKECLLFDSEWAKHLRLADGPFIDVDFYGSDIVSYRRELSAIGVTVGVEEGCQLLAGHLGIHSEFSTIVRIYNFLRGCKWEPDADAARRIWVPDGTESGEWVSPGECVLHDKHGLFEGKLNVLEKHYGPELLLFFAKTFNVKSNPSVDDYCELWKDWESSGQQLSHAECCAFWGCVVKHRNAKTEETLVDSLSKLPAISGSDGAILVDKRDIFIADDLQLKDLFQDNSPQPIFVWYPQPSLPSLPRTKLFEVYRKIGVRTLSEAVQKEELSLVNDIILKPVNPADTLIKRGLIKVILGFLAAPPLNMEADERHAAVQCLLDLSVVECEEQVTVSYSVSLSSGDVVNVKARRMIRWDWESSMLLMQKMEKNNGQKNLIEYATNFSNVISEALLWDKEDHISALSELIKLAFLLDFNEEAMDFLMKSKNLQIFMEDVEFLGSAFPSD
ncbi:uncharacterized protein LOC120003946 [Tripterygium wilfordii]|uniref:uncharacterized protein LOC120003946 n=1 Tax=Tripterygium wilfordii TaxID=458696 RepID=UPI0018F83D91|nr:uncharacterized protein LOC120003946 [Tripterygium wilfordii]